MTRLDDKMPLPMKIARGICIILIIVTYAVLVHHVNTSGQGSGLGAVLALAPILLMIFTFAWQAESRILGFGLIVSSIVFCWLFWTIVKQHTDIIFWMQDIGIMMILLLTFGLTLKKGRKPLCVHFAEIINGDVALPPAHVNYARQVTVAWVVFFTMIIIVSTLLFFLAPLVIWSIFVNFLTLPLVVLMFLIEYMVRRRVLTDLPIGDLFDAVRAYLNHAKRNR